MVQRRAGSTRSGLSGSAYHSCPGMLKRAALVACQMPSLAMATCCAGHWCGQGGARVCSAGAPGSAALGGQGEGRACQGLHVRPCPADSLLTWCWRRSSLCCSTATACWRLVHATARVTTLLDCLLQVQAHFSANENDPAGACPLNCSVLRHAPTATPQRRGIQGWEHTEETARSTPGV